MLGIEETKVMDAVIKNREKILILEKLMEELVNSGTVNQKDFRRFREEARQEVQRDFELQPSLN